MHNPMFEHKRKSHMELGQIYFWTATINKWQKLLLPDELKKAWLREGFEGRVLRVIIKVVLWGGIDVSVVSWGHEPRNGVVGGLHRFSFNQYCSTSGRMGVLGRINQSIRFSTLPKFQPTDLSVLVYDATGIYMDAELWQSFGRNQGAGITKK